MLHRDDRTPSRRIAVCTLVGSICAPGRMRDVRRGRGSRRIGRLAAVAALAVVSVPGTASAESAGLWSSSFQADPPSSSCGAFSFDGHFCYTANDGQGAVELGVKFSSTKSVDIVGVRAYRTDAGSVTGSLWSSDGTRLGSAAFTPYRGAHGWQDTLFTPVSIEPGEPYIASYHAPNADYAFQYSYFTDSAYRAGPMVAAQSVEGDGNGVFCYDAASCSFPTDTFRDSNYWVTPLWAYRFTGFYQPVDTAAAEHGQGGHGDTREVQPRRRPGAGRDRRRVAGDRNRSPDTSSQWTGSRHRQSGQHLAHLQRDRRPYTYVWKTNKAWAGRVIASISASTTSPRAHSTSSS